MAGTNGGNINFSVNMTVGKNNLNQILKPLKQIQSSTSNAGEGFQKAAASAKQLESIINSSWNDKLGQLNLDKFNQSIQKSYGGVKQLKDSLTGAGSAGEAAFNSLASQVLNTNLQLRESNKLLDDMATSMANTVKWGITSSIFNNITGSIQQAFYYAKDLDTALNNISIVTGDSADQMDRFAKTANSAAKDLGRSTLDYTKAALSFYQQGLGDEEVQARSQITLKAQNITGVGDEMVDYLTAVWNGFGATTETAESYVDKLAKVADASASDMSQLATAMSKVASTANVMGVDVDQLNAQLATVIATTRQAPESVGTAFKTIYSRLNDIKTGADDAEISLGNYSGKMAELGFNVLDANGNLRKTGQVMEQIGSRWNTLSKEQQIYLAQTMGGIRQVNQITALFEHWTTYSELLNDSLSAQGTLNEKNDIYLESTAAHMEQLGAETERTYDILFDQGTVNGFVDIFKEALTLFNDYLSGIGGGANVFLNLGMIAANVFNKQIGSAINTQIKNIETLKNNLGQIKAQQDFSQVVLDTTRSNHMGTNDVVSQTALQKQAEITQRTLQVRKALTQEQYNQLQQLQRQVGTEQTKIDYLNQYSNLLKQIGLSENTSAKSAQDYANYKKSQLDLQKQLYSYIELSLTPNQKLSEDQLKRVTIVSQILDTEGEEAEILVGISKEQQEILQALRDENLDQEKRKDLLEKQAALIEKQEKLVINATRAAQGKKAAEDGTLDNLKKEQEARQRIIKSQQDQAARQLAIQKAVQMTTGLVQTLSSAIGGISTALNDSATSTEKLNGAWAAGVGTISGIANIFAPGSGILIQGIGGIVQESLKLFGVWDKLEDHFKTAEEKINEIKQRTKQISNTNVDYSNSRKSIQDISEEFQELAKKRDTNIKLSEEEESRYHDLVDIITKYNEDAIKGYDSKGQAIVKNNGLIEATLELLDKQYQKEMRNLYAGADFQKTANAYKQRYNTAKENYDYYNNQNNNLDYVQMQENIDPLINGFKNKTGSIDFDEAVKVFSSEKESLSYGEALSNFINKIKDIEIEGFSSQKSELIEALKNRREEIKKIQEEIERQQKQAERELKDASQIDIATILGNIQWGSDQYQNIKNSYGKGFKQYGQQLIDNQIRSFLEGLQERIDSGEEIIPENYKGDIIKFAVDEVNNFLEEGFSNDNFNGSVLNEAIEKIFTAKDNLDKNLNASEVKITYKQKFNQIYESIQEAIKGIDFSDWTPQLRKAFSDNIAAIYNLSDLNIDFDNGGIVEYVETNTQELLSKIEQSMEGSAQDKHIFTSWLKENYSEEEISQAFTTIIDAIDHGSQNLNRDVTKFFEDLNQQEAANNIVENFSKVQSAINKLSDGKDLSWKDKLKLKEILPIEDLTQLQTNQEWLEEIKKGIFAIPEGQENAEAKIQGLIDVYKTIGDLEADLSDSSKQFNLSKSEEATVIQAILQKEMEAAGLTSEALQDYAKIKHMAYDTEEKKQAVVQAYNIEKGFKSLASSADSLKKALQLGETTTDVVEFNDKLRQLGVDFDPDYIINNIDAIAEALANGVTNAEELQKYIDNYTGEKTLTRQEQHNKNNEDFKTLTSARDSLQSGNQVSAEGIGALKELEGQYQILAVLAQTQGRYSASYLEQLNKILQVQQGVNRSLVEQELSESKILLAEKERALEALKREQPGGLEQQREAKEKIAELEKQISAQIEYQNQLQGELTQKQRELDSDVKKEEWQALSDYISDAAGQVEELSSQLKINKDAADDVAEAILRYDSALQSVYKNYQNWEQSLSSNNMQEQIQAANELQNVYSDLLGLPFEDGLSTDFTSDINNLHLLKQAANGSTQAYNTLLQTAYQDMIVHLGIDDSDLAQFNTTLSQIEAAIVNGIDDIEIGASIDDTAAIQAMNNLINSAQMTATQATNLLASMGVDAEVEQAKVPKNGFQQYVDADPEVTYEDVNVPNLLPFGLFPSTVQVPHISYKPVSSSVPIEGEQTVTALRVKSATKSSGGNLKFNTSSHGAGSAGVAARTPTPAKTITPKSPKSSTPKQPKTKDYKNDKVDHYAKVNDQLKILSNNLSRVQKQQDKLLGKALTDNLKQQLGILDQQIKKQKEKLAIARGQQEYLKKQLQGQGAKFDKKGVMTNSVQLLEEALNDYNEKIKKYNQMTAEQQEEYEQTTLKVAEKKYEDLKKQVERYGTLLTDEIPSIQEAIQDDLNKQIELKIKKFHIKVDLELDMRQAERDYNNFKKKVIDRVQQDDVLGNANYDLKDLDTYTRANTGTVALNAGHVNDILAELNKMDQGLSSKKYGDNRAQAVEDLRKYLDGLSDSMESVEKLFESIENATYDLIDQTDAAFDRQVDNYDYISDVIEHDVDTVKLLYGEDSYQALARFYKKAEQNNNKELDFLNKQRNFWYEKMVNQQKVRDSYQKNSVDWKKSNKLFETYQDKWKESLSKLNSKVEESIQNLQNKYANSINQIFNTWQKKLTNNKGFDYINEEWELINKQSEAYLDEVNSIYEIEKLKNAYQETINNNAGNLKAQRSLNNLMENQLKYLRDKDRLSQYDVDRANKLLEIEQKRLALEESRNNKTQLRLRRDSQGNYSYEYTNDKDELTKSRQQLLNAENELYNLTKQAYTNNLGTYYSLVTEWQDKVKNVYLDTTLTVKEQDQKVALLNKQYGQLINLNMQDNKNIRTKMVADTITAIAGQYDADTKNFDKETFQRLGISQRAVEAFTILSKRQYEKGTTNYGIEELKKQGLSDETIKEIQKDYGQDNINFSAAADANEDRFYRMTGKILTDTGDMTDKTNKKYDSIRQKVESVVLGGNTGIQPMWNSGLQTMINKMKDKGGFEPSVKGSLKEVKKSSDALWKSVEKVGTKSDTSTKKLGEGVDENLPKVQNLTQQNGKLLLHYTNQWKKLGQIKKRAEKVKNAYQAMKKSYQSTGKKGYQYLIDLKSHTDDVKGSIDKVVGSIKGLKEWIDEAVKSANNLSSSLGSTRQVNIDTSNNGDYGDNGSNGSDPNDDYDEGEEIFEPDYSGWGVKSQFMQGTDNKIMAWIEDENHNIQRQYGQIGYFYDYTDKYGIQHKAIGEAESVLEQIRGYDTGGYTGNWNSSKGKIAMLHEKQLVLNKEDTKNILSAVNIIRSMDGLLKGIMGNYNLPSMLSGLISSQSNQNLNQKVSIEAHFPNVTNHFEIEEAFNNLINQASQYVN